MKAYFISGLGCDRRVFQHTVLPAGYEIVHLDWLMPENNESIEHYAKRLAELISDTEPFILVGLSFGGMVAVEISKFKKPQKLFLISSIASRSSLPALYKACGSLRLDKIVPPRWLKYPNAAMYWVFGPLNQETKSLFKDILFETDPLFLKWALGVIARWKSNQLPDHFIQIHGKHDRIFPCAAGANVRVVDAGGHLCVYSNSEEVNRILKDELGFVAGDVF